MIQLNLHDDLHPFERPFLVGSFKALGVAIAGSLLIVAIQFVPICSRKELLFGGLVLVAFAFSRQVAIGLALVGLGEWIIETQFSCPTRFLSRLVTIVLMLPVVSATLWVPAPCPARAQTAAPLATKRRENYVWFDGFRLSRISNACR